MALSKANLQLQLLLIGKQTIMPILAGLVLYNSTITVLNLNTPSVQSYQEYYNLDLINMTALYIIMFVIILSTNIFWVRIILTALVVASWTLHLIDVGDIITEKSITISLIEAFFPPMLLALLCLYSIDILLFLMNFLRKRINQHHTPR
jgi:hypothetical protein